MLQQLNHNQCSDYYLSRETILLMVDWQKKLTLISFSKVLVVKDLISGFCCAFKSNSFNISLLLVHSMTWKWLALNSNLSQTKFSRGRQIPLLKCTPFKRCAYVPVMCNIMRKVLFQSALFFWFSISQFSWRFNGK